MSQAVHVSRTSPDFTNHPYWKVDHYATKAAMMMGRKLDASKNLAA